MLKMENWGLVVIDNNMATLPNAALLELVCKMEPETDFRGVILLFKYHIY